MPSAPWLESRQSIHSVCMYPIYHWKSRRTVHPALLLTYILSHRSNLPQWIIIFSHLTIYCSVVQENLMILLVLCFLRVVLTHFSRHFQAVTNRLKWTLSLTRPNSVAAWAALNTLLISHSTESWGSLCTPPALYTSASPLNNKLTRRQ